MLSFTSNTFKMTAANKDAHLQSSGNGRQATGCWLCRVTGQAATKSCIVSGELQLETAQRALNDARHLHPLGNEQLRQQPQFAE